MSPTRRRGVAPVGFFLPQGKGGGNLLKPINSMAAVFDQ
jgi:hypothetical protein